MTTCSPPPRLAPCWSRMRSASASAAGLGGRRVLRRQGSRLLKLASTSLVNASHVLVQTDHRAGAVGLTHVMAQQRRRAGRSRRRWWCRACAVHPHDLTRNGQAAASASVAAEADLRLIRDGAHRPLRQAGNGAGGIARSGSASARLTGPWSAPRRVGGGVAIELPADPVHRLACAAATVASSPTVRHQRCAMVCALFSTAPLRQA